jgi:GTP-binding protein HflX
VRRHPRECAPFPAAAWLSARTGAGVDGLLELIAQTLKPLPRPERVRIPADAGALRASLFRQGAVRSEQPDEEGGWVMQLEIDPPSLHRIVGEHGLRLDDLR